MRIVDQDAAHSAVQLALPTISRAMSDPAAGDSGCLHIVIMDPLALPTRASFAQGVLFEYSVNRERWDADYAAFARAKARLSWRTRMDSHAVQALHPHLLEPGDTLLWGGVCLDGLVVAVSGMQPWYDEALAGVIACCLRALAKAKARAASEKSLFLRS